MISEDKNKNQISQIFSQNYIITPKKNWIHKKYIRDSHFMKLYYDTLGLFNLSLFLAFFFYFFLGTN